MLDTPSCFYRFPAQGGPPNVLVVKNGWPDEATKSFEQEQFSEMAFQAYEGGDIAIPSLGLGALKIRRLELGGAGRIDGLDQFSNVEIISLSFVPSNGVDFSIFPCLQEFGYDYQKGLEHVFQCQTLISLCITKFPEPDFLKFGTLQNLREIHLIQGRLKNLRGIEDCKKLTTLSLMSMRTIESLDELEHAKSLSRLDLRGLPGLKKFIDLRSLKKFQRLELRSLHATVDLSYVAELPELKQIKLTAVPYVGLNLNDLILCKNLEFIWLPFSDECDVDILRVSCLKHNRTIKHIGKIGTGKEKSAFVSFHSEE